MIWLAITITLISSLVFFRWRLRRLRRCCTHDEHCRVAIQDVRIARAAMQTEIKALSDSTRLGGTTPAGTIVMVLVAVAFVFGMGIGREMPRESLKGVMCNGSEDRLGSGTDNDGRTGNVVQAVGGNAAVSSTPGSIPDGRRSVVKDCLITDAKLAELRTRPTLATVSYFESNVDHSRRGDVMPELERVANGPDKSAAMLARHAIRRWE